MASGQVFVAHGRIESVVHDAAVVPLGADRAFTGHWRPLLGHDEPAPGAGWDERGWAASDREGLWLIRVGPGEDVAVDELADRVGEVLTEIARAGLAPAAGRVKPGTERELALLRIGPPHKVEPAYPATDWAKAVRLIGSDLFPGKEQPKQDFEPAQRRELSRDALDGDRRTHPRTLDQRRERRSPLLRGPAQRRRPGDSGLA